MLRQIPRWRICPEKPRIIFGNKRLWRGDSGVGLQVLWVTKDFMRMGRELLKMEAEDR